MKLTDKVSDLPFVGKVYLKRLNKLGISTIEDLLFHLPHRYEDYRNISDFRRLSEGDLVTIQGAVTFSRNQYTKSNKQLQIVEIEKEGLRLTAVWFHQPYLIRSFKQGDLISLSGKIGWFSRKIALISPQWEKISGNDLIHTGRLLPIYPETAGISSKWLRRRIADAMKQVEVDEPYETGIVHELELCKIKDAIRFIHFPKNQEEAEKGRKRLAFDELLVLQAGNILRENRWRVKKTNYKLLISKKELTEFTNKLPFELTNAQIRATEELLNDMSGTVPMNRLLQGDVGSGKTAVAAAGCFAAFARGFQSIILAPTQILAQQHYETLNTMLKDFQARITLVTGEGIKGSLGRADIIVGTHALLFQKIDFSDIALLVIDEQHRFGVKQRAHITALAERDNNTPHVLTMTATPIPRTVALTFYGDLEISILDEMPKNRQEVKTWIVPPTKRESGYDWVIERIKTGEQAFVVCPLIEESEIENMEQVKAVKATHEELKKKYKKAKIGLLHGKLKGNEKDVVIDQFKNREFEILVSTPVVEVGIDVPNATIMLIEGAERFGLSQLHQLRGRVGRGDKQSYCLLMSESKTKKAIKRLQILKQTTSGFTLSEMDLKMRGPGEIFGHRQHGIPELKRATWQDVDLIKQSKKIATEIYSDPKKFPMAIKYIKNQQVAEN